MRIQTSLPIQFHLVNRNLHLCLTVIVCLLILALAPEYLAKPDPTGMTTKTGFTGGRFHKN